MQRTSGIRAWPEPISPPARCAVLTGRSPVGDNYLADIDAPTARFLQTVAWETVQDYYGK
jgi:hypothetical protein